MPRQELHAEVVVIGLGPGGEEVAAKLAQAGVSVVGVEHELVGGECPYWGCVPSKMIIRGADLLAEGRRITGVSGHADVTADFAPVAHRIRVEATDTWDDTVAVRRLEGQGARFLRGTGRLDGPGRVRVDLTDGGEATVAVSRAVVLATGARPVIPPIPGLHGTPFWTNRDILQVLTPPSTLCVLGGGAIGLELAQAMARFGSRVSVVEGLPRLLPLEEPEASEVVEAAVRRDGVDVRIGVPVTGVAHGPAGFTLTLGDGGQVSAERLLVATGRRPHLADLGLDTVGLDPAARVLIVDGHMRAGEGIWGVGDLTGVGAFTHIAMYQARYCIADILGTGDDTADYRGLARVTFTDPEVGSVGMSERQAREAGVDVAVGRTTVASSARGWIHGPGNDGIIKLVADRTRGVLVGATSVGPWGGEVLSMLTLAVHAAVPIGTLRSMIYAYPTFHRGVEDALRDLGL